MENFKRHLEIFLRKSQGVIVLIEGHPLTPWIAIGTHCCTYATPVLILQHKQMLILYV